ncbi:MAG: dephospho-CoA kinase [Candidatus Planktophila sp.]|nr:dephospho-CoA kinase [Candidatus Planktophila sp.]
MLVVGLTGGIGSGKSLAAQFFAELGALVIDADQLARDAIERGSEGFDQLIATFGDSILHNGLVDRRALGELVFRDAEAKKKLEAIIHPIVRKEFEEAVASLENDQILIYEIPLLFETRAMERFDFIVTVEADMQLRKERLLKKGLRNSEIESRIAAQASREERESIADQVFENHGSEDELLRSVENLWELLKMRSKG